MPAIVRDYVRTGKLNYELRFRSFLGRDSVRAAGAAAEAANQDLMYQFADIFFRNQGPENSGYADDDFMRDVARQVEGLDIEKVVAAADDPLAQPAVREGEQFARRHRLDQHPRLLHPQGRQHDAAPAPGHVARGLRGGDRRRARRLVSLRALRLATAALALAGIAIAGYLTWVHYAELEPVLRRRRWRLRARPGVGLGRAGRRARGRPGPRRLRRDPGQPRATRGARQHGRRVLLARRLRLQRVADLCGAGEDRCGVSVVCGECGADDGAGGGVGGADSARRRARRPGRLTFISCAT